MSDREFKIQIAYDEETSLLDLDKRFMLEIIAGRPRTYKVTSVDAITERFHQSGEIRGFLVLNVTQDLYNPETDNAELMICDYIDVDAPKPEPPADEGKIEFTYSGAPTIRQGGSTKKFSAQLYDAAGEVVGDAAYQWTISVVPDLEDKVVSQIDGNTVRLTALDYVELQGAVITLTVVSGNVQNTLEVEVVS